MRRFRRRTTTRRARAIGGRLEPSSPMGRRVARGSDSRGTIVTRHRAARGARERRAPRAAATIEFNDFSIVIRASRANLASGARAAPTAASWIDLSGKSSRLRREERCC